MQTAINLSNSNLNTTTKTKNDYNSNVRLITVPQNIVVKQKKKTFIEQDSAKKLQMAFLGTGILSSLVLMGFMLKSFSPFGKNKKLLKEIKKTNLPDNVRKKLLLEYDKLKNAFVDTDGNQNYIKNVLRLNWTKSTHKIVDIENARRILDEDHIGLDRVKNEIIAFLKVRNYNLRHGITNNGPLMICLDGPPGVGKTTIAESIAKAMERPFERISLAGVSNKSFIKGAERVFKNSEPGQIIKALQNAGVDNPVILLDEIDKMGSSIENGNPAYALLDVLEPKQCKNFTDENIELPYDLSNVTFVITSNDLNHIPEVLRDRLSIIHIPAYSRQEKINICKFTIQKMLKESQINSTQIEFNESGIQEIVNQTSDQGARGTIENIKNVFNCIKQKLETDDSEKLVINMSFVKDVLQNRILF